MIAIFSGFNNSNLILETNNNFILYLALLLNLAILLHSQLSDENNCGLWWSKYSDPLLK